MGRWVERLEGDMRGILGVGNVLDLDLGTGDKEQFNT